MRVEEPDTKLENEAAEPKLEKEAGA